MAYQLSIDTFTRTTLPESSYSDDNKQKRPSHSAQVLPHSVEGM
jgi:hypothetical protein